MLNEYGSVRLIRVTPTFGGGNANRATPLRVARFAAEDDLSDVVGGPEEMGFKLTFEQKWIKVSDGQREGVPECRGGEGEGSCRLQSGRSFGP